MKINMMRCHHKGILPIVIFLLLLNTCFSPVAFSQSKAEPELIKKGLPVWAKGREREMNLNLGFRGVFQSQKNQKAALRITASTLYRVYLNGQFLGYGPARAGHGFFRVDEYDLSNRVKSGENIVAVEVAGYNINTYYTLDQPSFLQAEVESDGKIVLATGSDNGFTAFRISERLQKVERYSFQRPFSEYYRVKKDFDQWKVSSKTAVESLVVSTTQSGKLLPRNLTLPDFNCVRPVSLYSKGTIQFVKPPKYYKDRSLRLINEKFKGYKESELEMLPSQMIQEVVTKSQEKIA